MEMEEELRRKREAKEAETEKEIDVGVSCTIYQIYSYQLSIRYIFHSLRTRDFFTHNVSNI